ncbi:MAG TPA: hypothetical protein VLC09_20275 [Polyangiaceae bacterium]|nr:hypothetical protein [Polyangiaceae bacterium]
MRSFIARPLLLSTVLLTACGGKTQVPWDSDSATVRGADGEVDEVPWGDGDCLELEGGACVDPDDECGGKAAADVYVNEAGEVVEVVCYPPNAGEKDVIDVSGLTDEETPAIDNNAVVVFDGDATAPAFEGNLEVETNNVVLYGDDPATAVIDGDVTLNGNNALVTGVTVTGNVQVYFNNAQFSNCVIEGNLVLEGNNAVVAGCHVLGNIVVKGQNNRLTLNRVDGNIENEGGNTECVDNYSGETLATGELLACE